MTQSWGRILGLGGHESGALQAGHSTTSTFGNWAVVAFLVVQALDGILTYLGISTFGPSVEGNPLIINLMAWVGEETALTVSKALAAFLGIVLHLTGVHRIVAFLTGFYFAAAIVPWTALLFF